LRMSKWRNKIISPSKPRTFETKTNRIKLLRGTFPPLRLLVLVVVIPDEFIIRLRRNAQRRAHHVINLP